MWTSLLAHPLAAATTTVLSAAVFFTEAAAKGTDYRGVALVLTAVATLIGALATAVGTIRLAFRRNNKPGVTLTDEQFEVLMKRK